MFLNSYIICKNIKFFAVRKSTKNEKEHNSKIIRKMLHVAGSRYVTLR